MPLLSNRFREQVSGVSGFITEAFDGISASFESLWGREHNPDGRHGDINVDSLRIGGRAVPLTTAYTATLADVVNTSVATTMVSFYVPGEAMLNGDRIDVTTFAKVLNNTGAARSFDMNVIWGGQSVGVLNVLLNVVGTEHIEEFSWNMIRDGITLYVGVTLQSEGYAGTQPDYSGIVTGINFAATSLVEIQMDFVTADANLYVKPQVTKVIHVSST